MPLLESNLNFINVKKLNGAIANTDTIPKFTLNTWFTGSYQRQEEQIVNDSFGFRNICVRVNNQVDYSLYNIAHEGNTIVGKDGYLFIDYYLDGYYGTDYLGAKSISRTMEKLKFINDTLAKLGKTLLLVIAPSKVMFFPEYLPDSPYKASDSTNYNAYIRSLKKSSIHYIDFNAYFIANKNKSKYPLEPKYGVHWSLYGADIAGDSLVKYIEKVRHINMLKPVWHIKTGKDTLTDEDIEDPMNLLYKLPGPLMAYPDITFKKDSTRTRPRVMTIGDSFYWELLGSYNIGSAFSSDNKFWYYFTNPDQMKLSQTQVKDEIKNNDIVMIVSTTQNLIVPGFGFVDTTYCMFKGISYAQQHSLEHIDRLEEIKEGIKMNNEWLRNIEKAASYDGISVDSALNINVRYIASQEKKN